MNQNKDEMNSTLYDSLCWLKLKKNEQKYNA